MASSLLKIQEVITHEIHEKNQPVPGSADDAVLLCFLLLDSEVVKIETADDLIGKTIGVQLGTTGDINIASNIENAKVNQYSKAIDAALALADGKIDCVIVDMEPAKNIVAANPALKIQTSITFDPEDYAIAVKKGNSELLGLIDVVLNEIKSDGTYDNLIKGFIETPQDERDAYITGDQIGTEGVLRVGTNAEFPPFEYTLDDGTIVGFDIEIAKLIAKKANKTLEIVNTAFDSLLLELDSGNVDFVIAGMTVDAERSAQVDFSASYYTSEQAVIVRADN